MYKTPLVRACVCLLLSAGATDVWWWWWWCCYAAIALSPLEQRMQITLKQWAVSRCKETANLPLCIPSADRWLRRFTATDTG